MLEIIENKIFVDNLLRTTYKEILENIDVMNGDIIYLGGSLIEGHINKYSIGMGNPYSDIDVFVVRDHQDFITSKGEYVEGVRKTSFCKANNINLDVEIYDKNYVNLLSNVLSNLRIEKDKRVLNILKENLETGNDFDFVNEFLTRFLYSICIKNCDLYCEIKNGYNFRAFLELKKVWLLNSIDSISEDVRGNLLIKQATTALYTFRQLLDTVMEFIIATEGVMIDRSKWIHLKFDNLVKSTNKYNGIHQIYLYFFRGELENDKATLEKINTFFSVLRKEIEIITLGELYI